MNRYRYIATNDEADSCSCCGRTGLKRVVWLVELDPDGGELGDAAPYGTTCGAHLLMDRQPAERKPRLHEAEKAIALALGKTRREILALVLQMTAPAPVESVNRYGVPVMICGEVQEPISCQRPEDARKSAAIRWLARRAWDIALSWGLKHNDAIPHHFVSMLVNRDDIKISES